MKEKGTMYICPICFMTCETEKECHAHRMVECNPGGPGDERRKPVENEHGQMVSRAPRWYMEAVGWLRSDTMR